jgi:flagellar protein FliO/FliZ
MRASIATLALAVASSPALAATTQSAPADLDVGGMLRVCASLGVVIALILGAGWLLRRLQGGVVRGGHLRAIESVAVGMKERVVLVQAGDKQLLVGVAPGNVRTLHVFETPIVDTKLADAQTPNAAFRSVLSQLRGAKS